MVNGFTWLYILWLVSWNPIEREIEGERVVENIKMHYAIVRTGIFTFADIIRYSLFTMKYTQTTLDHLEDIPKEAGYVLRYERGTFQSGYCILELKKVVVLNKFLQTEGRINTLLELIPQLEIKPETLTPGSAKLYAEIVSKLETQGNGE